nr:MAG TPA: hypothetical protein [Caudoviricetes sp.]
MCFLLNLILKTSKLVREYILLFVRIGLGVINYIHYIYLVIQILV